ncbi:MAG TPA: dihydrodipicolinate synthase family protein [Bryobacteraceae bacterium]|nr:dihydrodipicolinate synthase family protein [Bryobacteraceae bacterium]
MPVVSGVIAAAVTPRRDTPEIDLGSAFDLMDMLGRTGVNGIALMSAAGEFPHFSLEERGRLVSLAVKRSRVPLLAGVSHSTFAGALSLAREAADAGVAGVLAMPPYFFPYSQEDVREFYLRLAERLKGAVPVWIENAPRFTTPVEFSTAKELIATGQFAGIVEGGDNLAQLVAERGATPFGVLAGTDALATGAREAGADGIVSAAASAIPELVVALRPGKLEVRFAEFLAWTRELPPPVIIREAARRRGMKGSGPASPPGPEGARKLAEFGEWFDAWLTEVQKELTHG